MFLPARLMRLRRIVWLAGATLVLVATPALIGAARADHELGGVATARNVLLAIAVTTICGMLLPSRVAWVPPLLGGLLLWLFGTVDGVATPAAWSLPHRTGDDILSAAVSVAAWIVAAALYTALDGRARSD